MNKLIRFAKNDILSIIVSLVIFVVFAGLYMFTDMFEGMENGATNFRFKSRQLIKYSYKDTTSQVEQGVVVREKVSKNNIHKDLVIIGIDEPTLRYFDKDGIQWPFPWTSHAKVTRFLTRGNPAAIFFDIMFESRKAGQEQFAKAIAESDRTFLDYQFLSSEVYTKYDDLEDRMRVFEQMRFPIDPKDNEPEQYDDVLPPNPLLGKAASGIGFANVKPDSDKINRKMPLFAKYKGYYYPNIDIVVLLKYYGITAKDIEIKPGEYVKLKNIPLEKMIKPDPKREIIIPVDELCRMDINFVGPGFSFKSFPYYLFHNDDISKPIEGLQNKILLIAAYTTGMVDDVHKAPGLGDLFGIEHHASALNTILMQDFLYKFTDMQNVLILLVLALIMGYLFSRVNIIWTVIIAFLLLFGYVFLGFFLFDSKNMIVAFSTPLIMIGTNFALSTAFRLILEQNEKRYIRQTFSKFVSKSVVDELLRHPEKIKLGGDKKILTVLFSDVRGFTSLSEKLTPEQLVEHLNEYLQAMTDIVFKYYGTLDKYVGDELMAFWGAPVPQDDHALLACKSALEMMSVLHRMNKEWESIGKAPLDIGIGLNSGDMVVGNMGSNLRMDYTLMGDNVNLGARLEGTNKIYGTSIIISEFTYEMVKDQVLVRELDLIRVKGKQLPVKIYELVDVLV